MKHQHLKNFALIGLTSIVSLPAWAVVTDQQFAALAVRVTTLETSNADLKTKLTKLQTAINNNSVLKLNGKLGLNLAGDTVVFKGVNVQVVNGLGDTDSANGLGNLIIGYNEVAANINPVCTGGAQGIESQYFAGLCQGQGYYMLGSQHTGSHYLVTGMYNSYSRYGGIVSGWGNASTAAFASVIGGAENSAIASYASVTGGRGNQAISQFSSVTAGKSNWALGEYSSVTGGEANIADGMSSISGGFKNHVSYDYGSILGGFENIVAGKYSTVSGGALNNANGVAASVSGGAENIASGENSSVSGGHKNKTKGVQSSITGGNENFASGGISTVSGGSQREATDNYSWRAGGLFQNF